MVLRRAAILCLLAPVTAFLWYGVARRDYYFPGNYEDAVLGLAISLLIALPGLIYLLVEFVRLLVRTPEAKLVELQLPATWVPLTVPSGAVAYAPKADIAVHGADYDVLPLTLLVQSFDAAHAGSATILVGRRISSGQPDLFDSVIDGVRAEGFDYTDGVCDIVSWFVSRGLRLIEFQLAFRAPLDEPRAVRDLRALGEDLLSNVRWNP